MNIYCFLAGTCSNSCPDLLLNISKVAAKWSDPKVRPPPKVRPRLGPGTS